MTGLRGRFIDYKQQITVLADSDKTEGWEPEEEESTCPEGMHILGFQLQRDSRIEESSCAPIVGIKVLCMSKGARNAATSSDYSVVEVVRSEAGEWEEWKMSSNRNNFMCGFQSQFCSEDERVLVGLRMTLCSAFE